PAGAERAMPDRVDQILRLRAPGEVVEPIVLRVAVQVASDGPIGRTLPLEGFQDQGMDGRADTPAALGNQRDATVAVDVRDGVEPLPRAAAPGMALDATAPDRAVVPEAIAREPGDGGVARAVVGRLGSSHRRTSLTGSSLVRPRRG